MINSKRKIGNNRWVSYFMLFAFFWLVMGELITLHQKAIYGFDPFSQEVPFAKPDNSSKTKTDKGSKFDKTKDQYHFDFLISDTKKFNTVLAESQFEFSNTFTIFISQSGHPLILLRGPPSC